MKAVMGWVCDPYVHVFVTVGVLVGLGLGRGGDEQGTGEATLGVSRCLVCRTTHERENRCVRFVPGVATRLRHD